MLEEDPDDLEETMTEGVMMNFPLSLEKRRERISQTKRRETMKP